jgi:voltage-gated potassium channel
MLPESSTHRRWFEYSAQALVLYSIIVLYMETETRISGSSSAAFWIWNERILLALFTFEYVARWAMAKNRLRYPFTLLGVIDLLAIAPPLVGITSFRSLKMLRSLRMLRLLKLYRYNRALQNVMHGFRRVRHELAVVSFVAVIVLMASSMAIYEFEHDAQPDRFTRLSDAVWWSIVTLSTVGYGDLYPITSGGRVVGAITMLVGIGIFGTFISLVGSSFLATMRDERQEEAVPSLNTETMPPDGAPWTESPDINVPIPKTRFRPPVARSPENVRPEVSSHPTGNLRSDRPSR